MNSVNCVLLVVVLVLVIMCCMNKSNEGYSQNKRHNCRGSCSDSCIKKWEYKLKDMIKTVYRPGMIHIRPFKKKHCVPYIWRQQFEHLWKKLGNCGANDTFVFFARYDLGDWINPTHLYTRGKLK